MSFADALKRLDNIVMSRRPGQQAETCNVRRQDLRELLHHFHRLDAEVRNTPPQTKSVLGSIVRPEALTPCAEPLGENISEIGASEGRETGDSGLTALFDNLGSASVAEDTGIAFHNGLRTEARAQASPSRREIGDEAHVEQMPEEETPEATEREKNGRPTTNGSQPPCAIVEGVADDEDLIKGRSLRGDCVEPSPHMTGKPTIAVGTYTITELYAGRTVESDHVFMEPADDLTALGGSQMNFYEPTEDMLLAGEEAYHSAPKDENGCTAMAAAFKAILRAAPPQTSVAHCLLRAEQIGGIELVANAQVFARAFGVCKKLLRRLTPSIRPEISDMHVHGTFVTFGNGIFAKPAFFLTHSLVAHHLSIAVARYCNWQSKPSSQKFRDWHHSNWEAPSPQTRAMGGDLSFSAVPRSERP